jgi:hypothetical protein
MGFVLLSYFYLWSCGTLSFLPAPPQKRITPNYPLDGYRYSTIRRLRLWLGNMAGGI